MVQVLEWQSVTIKTILYYYIFFCLHVSFLCSLFAFCFCFWLLFFLMFFSAFSIIDFVCKRKPEHLFFFFVVVVVFSFMIIKSLYQIIYTKIPAFPALWMSFAESKEKNKKQKLEKYMNISTPIQITSLVDLKHNKC